MNRLERFYSSLVSLSSYLSYQRKSPVKVGFFTSVRMFFKGFYRESFVLYDLKNNDSRDYISDFARFRTRYINSEYKIILKDKDVFQKVTAPYIDSPRSFGIINRGTLVTPEGAGPAAQAVLALLAEWGKLIVKPITGSGGVNVMLLRAEGDAFLLNNKPIDRADLAERLAGLDYFLVSEVIEQGQYAAGIFPHSTNTIRLITMVNPKTAQPFIPTAVQRIGVTKSIPADNWAQGGLCANIDLETGTLGKAGHLSRAKGAMEWLSCHPETGAQIEGVQIPGWQAVKEKMLNIAANLSFLKYIGWDLVVTDKGLRVIEGNSFSGITTLQIHRGLLVDPAAREFFRYHKVV